jgi:hypothetical protein
VSVAIFHFSFFTFRFSLFTYIVACIGLEPISQGYEPRVLPLYELAISFADMERLELPPLGP